MAIKLRKYCPHCGSRNVHSRTAYPFDRKRVVYWCGYLPHTDAQGNVIPAGCGWVWCKPFDLWLIGQSLQEIEETGGIMFMDKEYEWEQINRCSCGCIFKSSKANWVQLDWTPKGVTSMVCPKCGKNGHYLESFYMRDSKNTINKA